MSFSTSQLIFAGVISLVLYCSFVFVQTVRHRDYFLVPQHGDADVPAPPPSANVARVSLGLLLLALVAIVGARQGTHTRSGTRNFMVWRTKGRRRHRHCDPGTIAREPRSPESGPSRSTTDQSEPGARIGAC